MTTDGGTALKKEYPFQVPCPPPAMRVPPAVYRMPPAIHRDGFTPVPSPPSGARVPADRIDWKRKETTNTSAEEALSAAPDCESDAMFSSLYEQRLVTDDGGGDGYAVPKRASEIYEDGEDVAGKFTDTTETDTLTSGRTECRGCIENPTHADNPTQEVGKLPFGGVMESSPQLQIPLAGNEIQIDALAELLGIKTYVVLKHLIELEIFAKTTDLITAETANVISSVYGVEIKPGNLSRSVNLTEGMNAGAPGSCDRTSFGINPYLFVSPGDWIRDSVLGLGRILKLHTHPENPDSHRVWFIGQTEEGPIIENHPLRPSTLGVLDRSMIPADIREAAPEIDQESDD